MNFFLLNSFYGVCFFTFQKICHRLKMKLLFILFDYFGFIDVLLTLFVRVEFEHTVTWN